MTQIAATTKPSPNNVKPPLDSPVEEDLSIDAVGLSARLFRPIRARLEAARDAVRDQLDPAEAWETLAARGVVDPSWISDGERVFAEDEVPPGLARGDRAQPSYEGVKQYLENGPRLCDLPPTVEFAALLASDVAGVETAERVARESVRRLKPWGCPQPTQVAWRLIHPEKWETQPGDFRHMVAALAVGFAFRPLESSLQQFIRAKRYSFGTPEWRAAYSWECAAQWREVQAKNYHVHRDALERAENSGYGEGSRSLWGQPFSSLANPFEPLVSLWAAGYALDAITPSLIVLAVPAEPKLVPKKRSR